MTDIKNALAQLRAARNGEEPQVVGTPESSSAKPPVQPKVSVQPQQEAEPEATPTVRGEIKTLAGRVPLPLHRELTRGLLDAADELKVSKINIDEALEAAMRVVLREGTATQLWYAQLREVRRERREG
ncbi:hypothetical protein [Deinococcus altitudinis]|uniref:hypothetical protein n=1 Tax=Deinococcus altitudinis TaxID=468914 RepID=UPI00389149F5